MHVQKILSDTTLIVLERTMYSAIILLLVQHRFQNLYLMVLVIETTIIGHLNMYLVKKIEKRTGMIHFLWNRRRLF